MKRKKISLVTVILSFTLVLCSCGGKSNTDSKDDSSFTTTTESVAPVNPFEQDSSEQEKTQSDCTPAMWKVTSSDGNSITCLGSMHAVKDSDYPLPDSIMDEYKKADTVAVEFDLVDFSEDLNKRYSITAKAKFTDGTKLKDVISDEAYKGVCHLAEEYDISADLINELKPWAVQNLFSSLSFDDTELKISKSIDVFFLNSAKKDGKEIYEVESADFQFDMLLGFSDEIYSMIFETYNNQTKNAMEKENMLLYNAWREGNTDLMEQISETEVQSDTLSEKNQQLYKEYNQVLIYDRNKTMVKKAEKLLSEKKNAFYVVGAGHLIGEKGVISLLEKDGYKVERIRY